MRTGDLAQYGENPITPEDLMRHKEEMSFAFHGLHATEQLAVGQCS